MGGRSRAVAPTPAPAIARPSPAAPMNMVPDTIGPQQFITSDAGTPSNQYEFIKDAAAGKDSAVPGMGDEDLTIFGKVEGAVNLTKTLIIESSGIVVADIEVQDAIISGVVVGNIAASNSVQITEEGRIFRYMGEDVTSSVDLNDANFDEDIGLWKEVRETQLIPQGTNISPSNSVATGGSLVLNDVRSEVEAYIKNEIVTAASVKVSGDETADIDATLDNAITSSSPWKISSSSKTPMPSTGSATSTIPSPRPDSPA